MLLVDKWVISSYIKHAQIERQGIETIFQGAEFSKLARRIGRKITAEIYGP